MDKIAWLSLFAGAALGAAMTAVPLLFPHMKAWVAGTLFYGGIAVFVLCVILLLVSKRAEPVKTEPPKLVGPKGPTAFTSIGNMNAHYDRITILGPHGIHEEGGRNNAYSDINVIDPSALQPEKPGDFVCWALRNGQWAFLSVSPDNIPKDVDGCMDPQTGQVWTAHEIAKMLKRGP